MPPESGEGREKYAVRANFFSSPLSRGLIVAKSLPHERYICHKPRIDKCWFGPWKEGAGNGPNNLRAYFELFNELTVFCTFLYYCL